MAWTAPRTWVTGEIVTAAHLNTHLRDNLIDLDRRTTPFFATIATQQGTTATSFTDLATVGPAVTVTIGSTGKALMSLYTYQYSSDVGGTGLIGSAISGATTYPATDANGALSFASPSSLQGIRHGCIVLWTGLNAGSTTVTAKYRSTSSTNTATFGDRMLSVTPLGS
jgi:hypothetical protein